MTIASRTILGQKIRQSLSSPVPCFRFRRPKSDRLPAPAFLECHWRRKSRRLGFTPSSDAVDPLRQLVGAYIQLLSDPHRESAPNSRTQPLPGADLLMRAGDIGSYQSGSLLSSRNISDFGLAWFSPLPARQGGAGWCALQPSRFRARQAPRRARLWRRQWARAAAGSAKLRSHEVFRAAGRPAPIGPDAAPSG